MHARTAALIALIIAAPLQAQTLYKCTDANGKAVFSQTKCAPDATAIDIDATRPTAAQIQQHQAQLAENQRLIDDGIARRLAQREAAAIARAETNLKINHQRELAAIQAKRARAANNQAGATWLNALSNDTTNANARYEAEMDRLRGAR